MIIAHMRTALLLPSASEEVSMNQAPREQHGLTAALLAGFTLAAGIGSDAL